MSDCRATYPDGGCPPPVTTHTSVEPKQGFLPNTGADLSTEALVGSAVLLVALVLVAIARWPIGKRKQ